MYEILILITTVQNVLFELNKANYEYIFNKKFTDISNYLWI